MFESCKALSLNSHETVLQITSPHSSNQTLDSLKKFFEARQIAFPQLLDLERKDNQTVLLLTGPQEIMTSIKNALVQNKDFVLHPTDFSTVTLTCTGSTAPEIPQQVMRLLDQAEIPAHKMMIHAMSVTVLVDSAARKNTLQALHAII